MSNKNNNNSYNADTSLGDTFRQRRSAKQKEIDQPQAQRSVSHPSTAARPPSILEIQAEEERLAHQARGRLEQDRAQYNSSSGGPAGRDDFSRRGERRGREEAFSSRRRGENDLSHLPLEQGCICSLKDAFGFIYCADRQEELFFHFSEVQNCHAADLALDDELEFRVGNDRNSDKLRAFQVNRLERGSIVWEVEDNPGVRYQGWWRGLSGRIDKALYSKRGDSDVGKPPRRASWGERNFSDRWSCNTFFTQ
ncbi:hypothetical protein MHU86_16287 [Fragilaria crotonensis]|nr:hypothetical protein MHU86_16287 [Fragilaria crotonensis]